MLAEARRLAILERLQRERVVEVASLSRALGVSEATIRRDLLRLEREGLVRRTHGGAVVRQVTPTESPFAERLMVRAQAKEAIGRLASQLVQDGDTLLIDSSTTTYHFARALRERADLQGLTVVTNDLKVAEVLDQPAASLTLLITGGELRPRTQSLVGPVAERMLAAVRMHKLFLSAMGVSIADGLTQADLPQASVKRAMLGAAEKVILLVDSSKIGVVSTHVVAPIDAVDLVVTDDGAPAGFVRELERGGKRVLRAAVGEGSPAPQESPAEAAR